MNTEQIRALGTECCAAFSQNPPDPDSRAWSLWADACAHVPFEAAPWIRDRIIENMDAMPRNFGKAVRDQFLLWRPEAAPSSAGTGPCRECGEDAPGFFLAWDYDKQGNPHRFLCRCACNEDRRYARTPAYTRRDAARKGWRVLPPGRSPAEFETELSSLAAAAKNDPNAQTKRPARTRQEENT